MVDIAKLANDEGMVLSLIDRMASMNRPFACDINIANRNPFAQKSLLMPCNTWHKPGSMTSVLSILKRDVNVEGLGTSDVGNVVNAYISSESK